MNCVTFTAARVDATHTPQPRERTLTVVGNRELHYSVGINGNIRNYTLFWLGLLTQNRVEVGYQKSPELLEAKILQLNEADVATLKASLVAQGPLFQNFADNEIEQDLERRLLAICFQQQILRILARIQTLGDNPNQPGAHDAIAQNASHLLHPLANTNRDVLRQALQEIPEGALREYQQQIEPSEGNDQFVDHYQRQLRRILEHRNRQGDEIPIVQIVERTLGPLASMKIQTLITVLQPISLDQLRTFKSSNVRQAPVRQAPLTGLDGQAYAVTINGQVVTAADRQTFLELLIPKLQMLGFASQVIQRLQDQVITQSLQAAELENRINLLSLQNHHGQDETWIALYRERLHGDDFLNAAIYFAKISQTNQKTVLNALIQRGDSKIFQLGFHLISNHEIAEGREIVDTQFPRQVADIILYHETRRFYFSLPNNEHDQGGWEMAVGNYPHDKRNERSHWVMAIEPKGVKERGSWKLVPQEKGKFFHIRFPAENKSETDWYYLSSHRSLVPDQRNDGSSQLNIHQPGYYGKSWELRYLPDDTFHLAMAEDYEGQKGWIISAHRFYERDKRHELSTWMIAHTPPHGNQLTIKMR